MTIEKINISEIGKLIDNNIGLCNLVVPGVDKNMVESVLDSQEYNEYLQDQIYRWVIKTFLVNAKLQACISEEQFALYLKNIKSEGGREGLAASIVLSSVPFASELNALQYVTLESEENTIAHLSVAAH